MYINLMEEKSILLFCSIINKFTIINGKFNSKICQTLLMVSVAYGQGRTQGGRMGSMHPPTSHFQKCF